MEPPSTDYKSKTKPLSKKETKLDLVPSKVISRKIVTFLTKRISRKPLNFLISRFSSQEKKILFEKIKQIGKLKNNSKIDGRVSENVEKDFTHLICQQDDCLPTEKVLLALLREKPIITSKFIDQMLSKEIINQIPNSENYIPQLGSEWKNFDLKKNEARKNILEGKTFLFFGENV
jgi:hypothetical protein